MTPLADEALKRTKPDIEIISPDKLISDPVEILDLDLTYIESSELSSIVSRKFVSVTSSNMFQGLALWFKVVFDHPETEWTQVDLNTSPHSLPTHWKQTLIPLFRKNTNEGQSSAVCLHI